MISILIGLMALSTAQAHVIAQGHAAVLADLNTLKALNMPVMAKSDYAGVGYAILSPEMQMRLSAVNHQAGRCGGFEVLPQQANFAGAPLSELQQLDAQVAKDARWASFSPRRFTMPRNPVVKQMIDATSEDNLRAFVTWASAFPNRYNRAQDPNIAVRALAQKIQQMAGSRFRGNVRGSTMQIEFVTHQSTKQQSLRVRLVGRSRPSEIVVLGGHFDSINQSGGNAPGADDNASGSANIFEALRIILASGFQPERTLEFFWYAGEESGLLGSAEIAKTYKAQNQQVKAVLQLDMTLFPGSGEFVIGSMNDFTSAWLRDFLVAANDAYLGAKIIDSRCGYGCSDHASWYRQGYPTLMPFEAAMNGSNRNIHTARDVIDNSSSFKHSNVYSKIAVIFATELGNSTASQPY